MDKTSIREMLCKNKDINNFITKNNISDDDIIKNLNTFFIYKDNIEVCDKCDGKKCLLDQDYTRGVLNYSLGEINFSYIDCPKYNKPLTGKFDVIAYSDNEIEINTDSQSRLELLTLFDNFKNNYKNKKFAKGVYLYGKCGVGKSLLLYSFAKNLVKNGANVLFAYYPDLVRELQSSITNGNLEKLILKLKKTDILMIDDIGRESNTQYIRDEVLGPVLQYRCDNNLPMFMTSNRDLNLLEKHLSDANNTIDTVKAKAMVSRIKYLMDDYELKDRDYRNN